jgi:hypothetical protein
MVHSYEEMRGLRKGNGVKKALVGWLVLCQLGLAQSWAQIFSPPASEIRQLAPAEQLPKTQPEIGTGRKKDPNQYLCVTAKNGDGVDCFHRGRMGDITHLTGPSLENFIRQYALVGQPVLHIDHNGDSAVAYLDGATDELLLYAMVPMDGPGIELVRQPWWTDFWYALDDEYWTSFERQIVREFPKTLSMPVSRGLIDFMEYEVSADMEDDERYTYGEVIQDYAMDYRPLSITPAPQGTLPSEQTKDVPAAAEPELQSLASPGLNFQVEELQEGNLDSDEKAENTSQ